MDESGFSKLTYFNCLAVRRAVCIGGVDKGELLTRFQCQGIELNVAGRELFADDRFRVSQSRLIVQTIEITVAHLGFAEGARSADFYEKAGQLGLSLCPLELGPHLRLQYLDQPEGHIGHPPMQHRAPPGSITIASSPVAEDDDIPMGFYLRRIDGVLWLRGYHAGPEHVWSPEDHFVFAVGASS